MRKYTILFLIICSALAISAQKATLIKGTIANNTEFKIIYLENILSEEITDSAEVSSNGKYKFKVDIAESDFYKLVLSDAVYVMYIPEPGEKAQIDMDVFNSDAPKISGSKQTELVYSTLDKNTSFNDKIEEYTLKIEAERKQMIRDMISTNPTSLACLFFIGELDAEQDYESYKMLSTGLKDHSDNYLVQDLQSQVEANSRLAIGSEAPEITLPTSIGDTVSLSSLRGNYVLIDFWAAWCRPCRAESPNLVKLYDKYHAKGFEIFSVSLDKEKDAWLQAIKDDKLGKWTHVSDLMFWSSEAATDYNVQAIPFTILLDKDGKIIAKDLRGEELENKIKELIGK